ncbi:MAG: high frequency lysogenization protein HflD [Gammaproteobacteria bacterium]|nr:high frequency lysogenization protein HflD [Gammaproteobacteria bacterium]
MQHNINDIVIALAGMEQAVSLLIELTQKGKIDEAAFQTCIYSILQNNPENISSVFGGTENLRLGLEKILITFDSSQPTDRLQHRYLLSLIHLQKRLSRSPKTLRILAERLEKIKKQAEYFSLTHPTVISNLADTYLATISTFKFRITILSNQRILQARENVEKIRALLLAGVRSATLWRQVGGSRLQLLFSRAKIKDAAETILYEIKHHTAQKDLT